MIYDIQKMGYVSWAPIHLVTNCRSNGILISMVMGSLHHMGWFSKYIIIFLLYAHIYMDIGLKLNTPMIGWSILKIDLNCVVPQLPNFDPYPYSIWLFDMYSTPLNKSRCGKPTLCRSFSKRRTMGFPHTPGYISARGNWINNRMESAGDLENWGNMWGHVPSSNLT